MLAQAQECVWQRAVMGERPYTVVVRGSVPTMSLILIRQFQEWTYCEARHQSIRFPSQRRLILIQACRLGFLFLQLRFDLRQG